MRVAALLLVLAFTAAPSSGALEASPPTRRPEASPSPRRPEASAPGSAEIAPAPVQSASGSQAAAPTSAPPPSLPFSVQASIAPGRVQIGERATLTMTIDAPASLVSARPRLEDRIGELEILGIEASPQMRAVERWQQRWAISVTSFEAGRLEVPEMPLEYLSVDGRSFVALWPSRVSVEVTAPRTTADAPLRGLTARADAPPPSRWRAIAIGAAGVAIVVPLAGIPLARWWLRRLNRARHAAFYRSLSADLAQLADSPCADAHDARTRYMRAAALVRQGAAPIAGGAIEALTSPELAARVSATTDAGARLATRLGVLLRAVDSVRFSNRMPAHAQHAAVLLEAQGVVSGMGSAGASRTARSGARKDAR